MALMSRLGNSSSYSSTDKNTYEGLSLRFISAVASRHRRFLCISAIILCAVVYIEFLSYHLNTWSWPRYTLTPKRLPLTPSRILEGEDVGLGVGKPFDLRDTNVLRFLLVADPQLIGEKEPKWWECGPIAIWDSDRYVRVNFDLATRHVEPNIVVFLGDLTNEGSVAYDAQYRRYYKRFTNVFSIPKKGDPSPVEYLYLPGDNDVGGDESPLDEIKLKWFNYTFGDYHEPFRVQEHGWNLEVLKIWTLDFRKTHANRPRPSPSPPGSQNTHTMTQILISHLPLLKFMTTTIEELAARLNPSLVISAHEHRSSLYTYDKVQKSGITYEQNFLSHQHQAAGSSKKVTLFDNDIARERMLYEISVPTCSYRMGVPEMGFGVLELHKNGTMEYSVLWLQSRFAYLYAYGALYVLLKLWLARWVLVRLWQRLVNPQGGHRYESLSLPVSSRSPD